MLGIRDFRNHWILTVAFSTLPDKPIGISHNPFSWLLGTGIATCIRVRQRSLIKIIDHPRFIDSTVNICFMIANCSIPMIAKSD
jgi:hypothetical protein